MLSNINEIKSRLESIDSVLKTTNSEEIWNLKDDIQNLKEYINIHTDHHDCILYIMESYQEIENQFKDIA